MYTVLVPVDEDEARAVAQADYVARLADDGDPVQATVLHVVPAIEHSPDYEVTFGDVGAAVRAADRLEAAGVSVTRRVDVGFVDETVVDAAAELDADEVVVGGRKRSSVSKAVLGSTAQDVLLSVDRPITVTGDGLELGEGVRRFLVPVDTDERRARNQAAYVAGLPGATDAVEATVLHVPPHQDYEGAPPHEFDDVDAAVAAAQFLESEGITVERAVVGGSVSRTILDAATDRGVDGIVMGGRKRSGVASVLFGSTSQDVVISADRAVTITG